MKVKELIEKLKELDGELRVLHLLICGMLVTEG